jgi:hypothetical protein
MKNQLLAVAFVFVLVPSSADAQKKLGITKTYSSAKNLTSMSTDSLELLSDRGLNVGMSASFSCEGVPPCKPDFVRLGFYSRPQYWVFDGNLTDTAVLIVGTGTGVQRHKAGAPEQITSRLASYPRPMIYEFVTLNVPADVFATIKDAVRVQIYVIEGGDFKGAFEMNKKQVQRLRDLASEIP